MYLTLTKFATLQDTHCLVICRAWARFSIMPRCWVVAFSRSSFDAIVTSFAARLPVRPTTPMTVYRSYKGNRKSSYRLFDELFIYLQLTGPFFILITIFLLPIIHFVYPLAPCISIFLDFIFCLVQKYPDILENGDFFSVFEKSFSPV